MRIVYDDTQTNTRINKVLDIPYSVLSNPLYGSSNDSSDCHVVWDLRTFNCWFPYSGDCRNTLKEKTER